MLPQPETKTNERQAREIAWWRSLVPNTINALVTADIQAQLGLKELTSYETAMNVSKIALRTQAESESRDHELGQPDIL